MKKHDCLNGYVFIEDANGKKYMRRCLICAEERFTREVGRVGCSWETWQEVEELASQVQVLRAWQGQRWSVCLHAASGESNFGTGKTHAGVATGVEWIRRGREVKYRYVPDLVDLHRRALFDNDLRVPALGDFPGLLILDDLGAEARTDWTTEFIDHLLDQRYRRLRPTLIASNLDLAAIAGRYPRVSSRLFEGFHLVWSAPDRREPRTP